MSDSTSSPGRQRFRSPRTVDETDSHLFGWHHRGRSRSTMSTSIRAPLKYAAASPTAALLIGFCLDLLHHDDERPRPDATRPAVSLGLRKVRIPGRGLHRRPPSRSPTHDVRVDPIKRRSRSETKSLNQKASWLAGAAHPRLGQGQGLMHPTERSAP